MRKQMSKEIIIYGTPRPGIRDTFNKARRHFVGHFHDYIPRARRRGPVYADQQITFNSDVIISGVYSRYRSYGTYSAARHEFAPLCPRPLLQGAEVPTFLRWFKRLD